MDQLRVQWCWGSDLKSQTTTHQEEWRNFSDIKSDIIEEAHNKDEPMVELDDYWIDLKTLTQISKSDSTKQNPINRLLIPENENENLRQERFFLSQLSNTSFTENDTEFISKWINENPTLYTSEIVELAAEGVISEGTKLNQKCESQWIARQLRAVKDKEWAEIRKCCVKLYTKECFLYKFINKTLRENDLTKLETIGPFCYLLFLHLQGIIKDTEVYRGATLDPDTIQFYKEAIDVWRCWSAFSSTSKNRRKAENFGNTLFIIKIERAIFSEDISSHSYYPTEEEVLLSPGTKFCVSKVEFVPENNKHYIYLRIFDHKRELRTPYETYVKEHDRTRRRIKKDIEKLRHIKSFIFEQTDFDESKLMTQSSISLPPKQRIVLPMSFTVTGRICPSNWPYSTHSYRIKITLEYGYPAIMPTIKFITPIFHSQVDKEGEIYGPPIGQVRRWQLTNDLALIVEAVLSTIEMGLCQGSELNWEAAEQYQKDRNRFNKIAQDWANKYGLPKE